MLFSLPALPPEHLAVIASIDDLRQQLRYATSDNRRRWTGTLRRNAFALAVQGSNSIEGYNVTREDAVAAVDHEAPFDADDEAWKAVSGYRAAMSYILQLADDPHFQHNEGTLNSLHYMMVAFDLKANPGRWRRGAIWVRSEPSGDTVYEGPDVAQVPGLMRELVASLQAENSLPAMVRAALAHLNLVMIHPYSDGNGRMARALQTLVLAREGVVDPVFSSIEEYLGHHTAEYYRVLAEVGRGAWNPQHDVLPWLRFCLTAHHRQAASLLRRTTEMQVLWDELEREAQRLKLHERTLPALADAAMGLRLRNSGYRKQAEVSEEVASKDLRTLVERGLLAPQGERRGRHYIATPALQALGQKAARSRSSALLPDPFEVLRRD